MKHVITLFIFLLTADLSIAQVDTNFIDVKKSKRYNDKTTSLSDNNVIYAELLGSTYGIGINYERKIISTPLLSLNARIGIGTLFFVSAAPTIGFNVLAGRRKNFLEFGFNANRTYALDLFFAGANTYWLGNPILGYRYISKSGFVFRFSFTPLLNVFNAEIGNEFVPFLGLSLGKTF
jgi:hypothetical protein